MIPPTIGMLLAIYCQLQWEKHQTEASLLRRYSDPKHAAAIIPRRRRQVLVHCALAIVSTLLASLLIELWPILAGSYGAN